jgi:two-component system chemotaxis response regulator CheB
VKRLNVLLVDDDPSIRALLRVVFSVEEGFGEVRVAASGPDAVTLAEDFQPDVIFLDYWMPAMDGRQTASALRELHPDARIVAFSGVIESKPEWADEYVVKGRTHTLDRVVDLARGA